MVELAGAGTPFILVASTGEILGYWCIIQVNESGSYQDKEGKCCKIEFSVSITYYGDEWGMQQVLDANPRLVIGCSITSRSNNKAS